MSALCVKLSIHRFRDQHFSFPVRSNDGGLRYDRIPYTSFNVEVHCQYPTPIFCAYGQRSHRGG
jgi:hypothetical protein